MKSFIKILTIIGLVSFAMKTKAQVAPKITGTVIRTDKSPVEFATVILLNAKDSSLVKGAIATIEGKYEFDKVAPGKYLVAGYHAGMPKVFGLPFQWTAQKGLSLDAITLVEKAQQLNAVEVVAKRPFIEQHADKLVVNVESSIVGPGGTAMDVLEKSPSILVDKDDNISLKGKSGVIIMIDGKITNMSSQDLAQLLRSMPSSNLDQIELISNPSAKYDAAGNAGIINLKLKKNKNYGANGNINLSGGMGIYPKVNTGINLNYRNKNVNLYGSYNYSFRQNYQDLHIDRAGTEGDHPIRFDQRTRMSKVSRFQSFKAGADYFIGKNHTVGFMVDGFIRNLNIDNKAVSYIGDNVVVDSVLRTIAYNKPTGDRFNYNLNYRGKLDTLGREINVDIDYSKHRADVTSLFHAAVWDGNEKAITGADTTRSMQPSDIRLKSAKIDYVHPLKDGSKFELGVKSSFVTSDNNAVFDSLKQSDWKVDFNRTNHFIYKENINAAYINYIRQIKKWGIQAGLRAEQTNIETSSYAVKNAFADTSYINLFPSLAVSWNANENNQLAVSYSRRLRRPNYDQLNPFEFYLDRYTKEAGNPYLKPQYSNNFELTHTFRKFLTSSIGYAHTNNTIMRIVEPDIDPATGDTTFVRYKVMNVDNRDNFSLNISAQVPFTKWWSAFVTTSLYYNHYKTFVGKQLVDRGSAGFYGQIQNSFDLPKHFSLQLSYNYISPQIADEGLFRMSAMHGVDFGVRKQVLDKKGTLSLNVQDVFNTRKFRGTYELENQHLEINNKWESRVITLSFSYRFGNMNVKESRKRKGGAEEEQSRL